MSYAGNITLNPAHKHTLFSLGDEDAVYVHDTGAFLVDDSGRIHVGTGEQVDLGTLDADARAIAEDARSWFGPGDTYSRAATAELDGIEPTWAPLTWSVSIYADGAWACRGRLIDEQIVDAEADLGDEVYSVLEKALCDAIAEIDLRTETSVEVDCTVGDTTYSAIALLAA